VLSERKDFANQEEDVTEPIANCKLPQIKYLATSASASNNIIDMKLTTRGHYSVKAMLDLSLQPDYGPASVSAIASRQNLPIPYLEKLLIELRRAGLVNSIRGANGGYQLAKKPTQISLSDILIAVGESMALAESPLQRTRSTQVADPNATDWVTLMVWRRLNEKLQAALASISLADLYYDARSWQAAQGEVTNYII
jgi:Rrf2 family transcriptional regulator, iron-sulfur cluster assembly transcription factor